MIRRRYHDDLDRIWDLLLALSQLAETAVQRATAALLDANLQLAERVIGDDALIDATRKDVDELAFGLMARQQPVAGELRLLISSISMSAALERMGGLASHIARLARMRFPDIAVPVELRDVIAQMGETATALAAEVSAAIAERDADRAAAMPAADEAMNALHQQMFTILLSPRWQHGTEIAIDVTLLGRYYERFADHAVGVARRVDFILTGRRPSPTEE